MEQTERIEFRTIRNVAEIMNATFDFIRENFRLLVQSLLRIALPPMVVAVAIFTYFFIEIVRVVEAQGDAVGMISLFFLAAMVGGILLAVGTTLMIAVVHVVARLCMERKGEEITFSDVWKDTKEIFWMLFWTNVGLGVVITILSVILALVPFGGLGMYALYTFGALYFPLRIYDRRGFLQSFVVSSSLVQGRWWATLGLIVLQVLMVTVLTGLLILPILIFSILSALGVVDIEQLVETTSWLGWIGAALGTFYLSFLLLGTAVGALSLIFHYYSQRERKEAPGLIEDVEKIGEMASV